MKRLYLIIFMAILITIPLFSVNAMAQSKADKYLGKSEMCLETERIKETRILDDQTILFEMLGGTIYLTRLPVKCNSLNISGGFQYSTSNNKLCKQDNIRVIEPGQNLGSSCPLGEFFLYKEKGTLDEVERLLKGGLLKELVDENIFESAFPEKR
jgi:hypothetical protein